jgi:hypothetical protein
MKKSTFIDYGVMMAAPMESNTRSIDRVFFYLCCGMGFHQTDMPAAL